MPLTPRPTTVPDAAVQLPITRGNTGGLNRPINPDNQPLGEAVKRREHIPDAGPRSWVTPPRGY